MQFYRVFNFLSFFVLCASSSAFSCSTSAGSLIVKEDVVETSSDIGAESLSILARLNESRVTFAYPAGDRFDVLRNRHKTTVDEIKGYTTEPSFDDPLYMDKPDEINLYLIVSNLCSPRLDSPFTPIQSLYNGAQRIKTLSCIIKPSMIFGLGRAPSALIDMLQQLYALAPESYMPNIFSLAFSGCPDVDTMNASFASYLRNVMVPKRVNTFFSYLDKLGFDKVTGEIWCTDMVTTGSSLNSFLRLLREYYISRKTDFPKFRFLGLDFGEKNKVMYISQKLLINIDSTKLQLTFTDVMKERGYMPMTFSYIPLEVPFKTCGLLDSDGMESRCAQVSEYRAFQMKEGSDLWRETPARLHSDFVNFAIRPFAKYLLSKRGLSSKLLSVEENEQMFMQFCRQYAPTSEHPLHLFFMGNQPAQTKKFYDTAKATKPKEVYELMERNFFEYVTLMGLRGTIQVVAESKEDKICDTPC